MSILSVLGIAGGRYGIIGLAIPVRDPLPNVPSHIQGAVRAGAEGVAANFDCIADAFRIIGFVA